MRLLTSLLLILSSTLLLTAQSVDTTTINRKGLTRAIVASSAVYGASLVSLNHLWYRHADKQRFRFFNDNAEWKQMDKAGHAFSSFYISHGISRGLQHYRVPERKADLIGAVAGFALLLPIEIFDGYSDAYGASTGDLVANATGPLLYFSQKRLWNEVRIIPKYSFHFTRYGDMRPDVLGYGAEQIIKDYNGHTVWLSVDMDKFVKFPRWLNLAVGHGAEGMIYARDEQHVDIPQPYRQFYLGIDFDLTAIRTNSKALKTVLFFVSMIRLPAPAVEWSRGQTRFHAFYF